MRFLRSPILIAAAALFVPLPLSCKAGSSESDPSSESGAASAPANVQQATLRVEGMTCGACNVTVEIAAEKVDGVTEARASHEQGRARVSFDPERTSPAAIGQAITEAGYEATPEPSAAN